MGVSHTSEDELARTQVTPAKRLRPAHLPSNDESPVGRGSRTAAFEDLHSAAVASLSPPQGQAQASMGGSRNSLGRDSLARSKSCTKQPQRAEDGGQSYEMHPMTVSSERMDYDGESGWCVCHKGKSIFVSYSKWTPREGNGQRGLYCSSFGIFISPSVGSGRG